MPLAPNVLLQANAATAARSASASSSLKPADNGKDEASAFSNVLTRQSKDKTVATREVPQAPVREKAAPVKDKAVAVKDKAADKPDVADDKHAVAESGNRLPADKDKVAEARDKDASDGQQDDSTAATAAGADASAQAAAEAAQAAQAQSAALEITPLPVTAATVADAAEQAFDPDADPLDGLHALQFALENNRQATGQAAVGQDKGAPASTPADDEAARMQGLVNNLANFNGQQADGEGSTEKGDQAFAGLLDDGLKDVKGASGDTRVDNFADRLAALSQAAQQPRAVAAVPGAVLNQPLAMHQSGWSEGIVERVMYLSSQNLKSADIKLEPAELGRLDIRVNMAPDQQTQVTFVSAHLGVRDALESQVARLRESFSQQGLGQVDVNVSDQSQQQQAQQQAQEQASRAGRGGGLHHESGSDEGLDGSLPDAAVAVSQPVQRVIGSSEIDYYA